MPSRRQEGDVTHSTDTDIKTIVKHWNDVDMTVGNFDDVPLYPGKSYQLHCFNLLTKLD